VLDRGSNSSQVRHRLHRRPVELEGAAPREPPAEPPVADRSRSPPRLRRRPGVRSPRSPPSAPAGAPTLSGRPSASVSRSCGARPRSEQARPRAPRRRRSTLARPRLPGAGPRRGGSPSAARTAMATQLVAGIGGSIRESRADVSVSLGGGAPSGCTRTVAEQRRNAAARLAALRRRVAGGGTARRASPRASRTTRRSRRGDRLSPSAALDGR